ncbi:collagen-like triple helix repeat-containing protein [Flagellimonas myxillae]|uniref:collagen-like triple helix repeat-containing protein n=1 Tax=Flagellimonas myxillae TaxID=2942214 RepID=UPI00201ED47F|nr:collagen-like protein [Muricauda myxillae]MCL6265159.1 collagen-like protein [Muricauda myxillae]
MKFLLKTTQSTFLTILLIGLAACSPEDGQDGAPGPQGPQGEQGAAGQDGVDGNANVRTGTVDLANADWLWNASYTFNTGEGGASSTSWFTRYVDLSIPEIDEDINENGLILVYFRRGSNGWYSLPFKFTAFGSDYETQIVHESNVGNIRLHYFWTPVQGSTPGNLQSFTIAEYTFKYVIIQGTLIGKNSGYSKKALQKMTYEEVMDVFALDY